jgi:hypothetical protein
MFLKEHGMTGRIINSERRSKHRLPVTLEVVLYCNTIMLPQCQIRDISPEGAFVDTGGHFLPDQALVDLAFSATLAGGVPQRFTAQVVRCTDEGVGVRLRDTDNNAMRHLIETLYAA